MDASPVAAARWDAIIVGGGPAGLNAALVLGRCRRSVLLFDDGKPRNRVSHALHGFLSRDGIAPAQLRAIGREQLAAYPSVTIVDAEVLVAARVGTDFSVATRDGRSFRTRKLLLAAGVADMLPQQPGFWNFTGQGCSTVRTVTAGRCGTSHSRYTAAETIKEADWRWR